MTSKERVLQVWPDAWQSISGRVWKSQQGFIDSGHVEGKHSEQTEFFLGRDWDDAASRLPVAAPVPQPSPSLPETVTAEAKYISPHYRAEVLAKRISDAVEFINTMKTVNPLVSDSDAAIVLYGKWQDALKASTPELVRDLRDALNWAASKNHPLIAKANQFLKEPQ